LKLGRGWRQKKKQKREKKAAPRVRWGGQRSKKGIGKGKKGKKVRGREKGGRRSNRGGKGLARTSFFSPRGGLRVGRKREPEKEKSLGRRGGRPERGRPCGQKGFRVLKTSFPQWLFKVTGVQDSLGNKSRRCGRESSNVSLEPPKKPKRVRDNEERKEQRKKAQAKKRTMLRGISALISDEGEEEELHKKPRIRKLKGKSAPRGCGEPNKKGKTTLKQKRRERGKFDISTRLVVATQQRPHQRPTKKSGKKGVEAEN